LDLYIALFTHFIACGVWEAVYIIDASGRQRRGRQIMLPRAWEYEPNLPRIAGGMSSQSLLDEVARHRRQRLPFE